MKSIRFAFAVGKDNLMSENNFSDADKIQIFEYFFIEKKFILISEIKNSIMELDNDDDKCSILIKLLNINNVDILIAKSYSRILRVKHKFHVHLIGSSTTPQDTFKDIKTNFKWISDKLWIEKCRHLIFNIERGF